MQLTVFNGSPRGKKGNTKILMDKFLDGFRKIAGNDAEVHYLDNREKRKQAARIFANSEAVIVSFPLYSDSTPGLVKEFIESLAPFKGRKGNPKLGFVVQSGFPEGIHTACVERYLEKLARRLRCPYIGTIRKGGVEGIQRKTEKANRPLYRDFETLGESFGRTGSFDPAIVERFKKPERLPRAIFPLFYIMMKFGIMDMGWNRLLKASDAFAKRLDRPFA
jgi:NAD(P)H-dependent FMN reductase